MYNIEKLLILCKLFKNDFSIGKSSVHVHSFLKNMSIAFLKKLNHQSYRILYAFFLVSKSAMLKHYAFKSEYCHKQLRSYTNGPQSVNSKCFVLFSVKQSYLRTDLVRWYKKLLIYYRWLFLLGSVYNYLSTCLASPIFRVISMPLNNRTKTLLRSPHIDKRSREQFERVTRHSFMRVPYFFFDISGIVKLSMPTFGVEITQWLTLKR